MSALDNALTLPCNDSSRKSSSQDPGSFRLIPQFAYPKRTGLSNSGLACFSHSVCSCHDFRHHSGHLLLLVCLCKFCNSISDNSVFLRQCCLYWRLSQVTKGCSYVTFLFHFAVPQVIVSYPFLFPARVWLWRCEQFTFSFVVLERVTLSYAFGNLFVSHNYAFYDAIACHPELSIITICNYF